MEFNKVVLSIHAHPDDGEAWNAGTLKLLKDRGYEIVVATLTRGDLGGCNKVMDKSEVLVWVDPFKEEETKFNECLVKGVGMKIISITSGTSIFPSITIPDGGKYREYVQLAAGWNLLVEIGLALGIDLDKPVRARKVGNEYIGG